MIELTLPLRYNEAMKRVSFPTIAAASVERLLNSLDLRERPRYRPLEPGETVAAAWAATGGYLRTAMDHYDQASKTRSSRSSR